VNPLGRCLGLLLPFALLASGPEAFADVPSSRAPVYARLVAPAAGVELEAGSLATLQWEGLALPARAEEWEAFLSVDGGASYPLRITPHLDLSIRLFTFRVPRFPTRDARLLLRFGDERHEEVEFEAPWRFAILDGPSADLSLAPARALARGERARPLDPNDQGVVLWIEGSREGGDLREVAATRVLTTMDAVDTPAFPWLPLVGPSPVRNLLRPPEIAEASFSSSLDQPASRPSVPRPAAAPVRLLIHRFNE
jgi:hypothetical protein